MGSKKLVIALAGALSMGSLALGFQSANHIKDYQVNSENIKAIAGYRDSTIDSFKEDNTYKKIEVNKARAGNILADIKAKKEAEEDALLAKAQEKKEKQEKKEEVKEVETAKLEVQSDQSQVQQPAKEAVKAEEETVAKEQAAVKEEVEEKTEEVVEETTEIDEPVVEEVQVAQKEDEEVTLTGFTTDVLNVRTEPNDKSEVLASLASGADLTGVRKDGWIKINYNGVAGYVSADFVDFEPETEQITSVDILEEDLHLSANEEDWVEETEEVEVSEEDEPRAEIHGPIVDQIASFSVGQMIDDATSLIGNVPYVFGGSDLDGFDCSGLTSYLYQKHFGVWIGRVTTDQLYAGYEVEPEYMVPGDLVLFQSGESCDHVGMYIGNGNYIHASDETRGICIDPIEGSYFQDSFISARRIVD